MKNYYTLVDGYNYDIKYNNNFFIEIDHNVYELIKNKMFEKIKENLTLLNEGIILISQISNRIK